MTAGRAPALPSLAAFLDHARQLVDDGLERYLPGAPECPPLLSEAMRYSLFAGGKRLRPVLTLAAADAVARRDGRELPSGSSPDPIADALPAACAIEMIHTYSLIHDDLPAMDNDTLRRGRPTLHVVYGDGMAILAGDALQAEAFALLARDPADRDSHMAARRLRVVALVARAAGSIGMVGGQTIDLQGAGQTPGHPLTLDAEGLRDMHRRKTGAMIAAAAEAGAVMGGGDEAQIGAVRRWAVDIGLAFQIIDDILDVEGAAAELGKTAGKDAAGAKPTYPSLYGLERSRALAAECRARADAVLAEAGLAGSWLPAIGDWVVTRRN